MQLQVLNRLALLALVTAPINVLAVPFAIGDIGVERSPAMENQLFPRAADCTCCRPAQTIVLTSTKLNTGRVVETSYTTLTRTRTVNLRVTTTVTPLVTSDVPVTVTTTLGASGACASSGANLIPEGDFETVPNNPPWNSPFERYNQASFYPYNKGQGGSAGHLILGCGAAAGDNGCYQAFVRSIDLCPGAGYSLSIYHAFNKGPGGDGSCRFVANVNSGELIINRQSTPATSRNDPSVHPAGDIPWTRINANFVAPPALEGGGHKLWLGIECYGERAGKSDWLYLDTLSLVRNDGITVTETRTTTHTIEPTTTRWETEAADPATFTLTGGTTFWKRDGDIVRRGPTLTMAECDCTNVECMTAVATTSKITITTYTTTTVTRAAPAETTSITSTILVTISARTKATTQVPTVVKTETIQNTVAPSIPTVTLFAFTLLVGSFEATSTTTFTYDGPVATATYSQLAYEPEAYRINPIGRRQGPPTYGRDRKTPEFHMRRCAQWCAETPECFDWGVYSNLGINPPGWPDWYCIAFSPFYRLTEHNQDEWLQFVGDNTNDATAWIRLD